MRINELKWSGNINQGMQWTPVFVTIGSNIRGRRFQRGSAIFSHLELERALTPNNDASENRLRKWLDILNTCYVREDNIEN